MQGLGAGLTKREQSTGDQDGQEKLAGGNSVAEPSNDQTGDNAANGSERAGDSSVGRGLISTIDGFHQHSGKGGVNASCHAHEEKECADPEHRGRGNLPEFAFAGLLDFGGSCFGGRRDKVFPYQQMDKHPSYNVEESAGKEGDPVAKVVYHQTASEISGDISAPNAGAQQTQCGAVPFFGCRCHEECLRRIDRTGEEGGEEADAQEPPEVAGKGEKGIEDSSRVTGAEQHDFASVFRPRPKRGQGELLMLNYKRLNYKRHLAHSPKKRIHSKKCDKNPLPPAPCQSYSGVGA